MDFNKMADEGSMPIAKLSIKNKGSIVKISEFYVNLYNTLLEKYGLRCEEEKYWHSEVTADGQKRIRWTWFAYKNLDSFSRVKFELDVNAFYVKDNKVMGIFKVSYKMEFDYKKLWANSKLLKWFMQYYLKNFYQARIIQWFVRYKEELDSIKEQVRQHLNVSVFE